MGGIDEERDSANHTRCVDQGGQARVGRLLWMRGNLQESGEEKCK